MITIPQLCAIMAVTYLLASLAMNALWRRWHKRQTDRLRVAHATEMRQILQTLDTMRLQAELEQEEAGALADLEFTLRTAFEEMMPALLGHREIPGCYDCDHAYLEAMNDWINQAIWKYENRSLSGGEE